MQRGEWTVDQGEGKWWEIIMDKRGKGREEMAVSSEFDGLGI